MLQRVMDTLLDASFIEDKSLNRVPYPVEEQAISKCWRDIRQGVRVRDWHRQFKRAI